MNDGRLRDVHLSSFESAEFCHPAQNNALITWQIFSSCHPKGSNQRRNFYDEKKKYFYWSLIGSLFMFLIHLVCLYLCVNWVHILCCIFFFNFCFVTCVCWEFYEYNTWRTHFFSHSLSSTKSKNLWFFFKAFKTKDKWFQFSDKI